MMQIASIVEGDGEVAALPVLLRRMVEQWPEPSGNYVHVLPPIRVRRDRFLNKDEELRRQILLASGKAGDGGWVLVILDADDDCPVKIANFVLRKAEEYAPHCNLSVVIANREFEAWFIASAPSMVGFKGFALRQGDEDKLSQADIPRNAKGWIEERMTESYKEILHQPALAARIDFDLALENSRSFRKLRDEWKRHVEGRR